ncbi:MAG: heme biosynthesis HemY N-terminal domain-containing protein [Rhodoferax sp.]
MRLALWLLGLFAVAVAAALFAGNNPGSITVFWPPYRVDLSLNLVLVLLLGAFLTLHLAWRALAALFAIPREARQWRLRQRERNMQQALLDALSNLVAGRFVRARKAAESVLVQVRAIEAHGDHLGYAGHLQAVSHLLAAEAAHALQDHKARETHRQAALEQAGAGAAPETREGVQLRAARWALDDRDAATTLQVLDGLGQGAARRTLALRMRLKAARMAQRTAVALETARLLAKHRALSPVAAEGVLRGLAIERLLGAHDPAQLQKAWGELDPAERAMPDVAIQAAGRLHDLGGDAQLARQWLLPVWERLVAQPSGLDAPRAVQLVRVLERGFAGAAGAPDSAWLARIETAQMHNPGDPVLQYLAGVTCMRLQLWGKASQLLTQSLARLQDDGLRRDAWRQLAELADRNGDQAAATQAWRNAAQR